MHGTKAQGKEVRIDRLVAEVEIPRMSIVCKAIPLQTITNPLEFPTASLVLALPLTLGRLLVDQKSLSQQPCLLPNVPKPTEEFVDLYVEALLLWRRDHQRILCGEEVAK